MNFWKWSVFILSLSVCAAHATPPLDIDSDFDKLTPEQIELRLQGEHPSRYLVYAGKLWAAGKKDEAVFWYYVGQLRYRFYLMATPKDPSGDPALLSSLMEVIGRPINVYAGGDPKNWVSQMDAALAWDERAPNDFTSKSTYKKQLAEVRSGLEKLRDYVSSNQQQITAQREQNGIGENGLINGVYVEEQREKMPKDWPPLLPHSTNASIAGIYTNSSDSLLGPVLFFADQYKVLRADTIELSFVDSGSLEAIAKRGEAELLRRSIAIHQEDDAVVFEEIKTAAQSGLSEGEAKNKILLRTNTAGELVIQRDSLTEGKEVNKPTPIRLSYTWWSRAKRAASN